MVTPFEALQREEMISFTRILFRRYIVPIVQTSCLESLFSVYSQ